MKFLLLLVFVIIGFGLLFYSLLKDFKHMMLGKQAFGSAARANSQKSDFSDEDQSKATSEKVFDKNEGEYVSYEEIKD